MCDMFTFVLVLFNDYIIDYVFEFFIQLIIEQKLISWNIFM